MKQLKLNRIDFRNSRPFGGELMKKASGRGARPLTTKKSMHLVLRSRRPFSRGIEWGKAYTLAKDYILLNQLEAAGVFCYQPNRLRDVALHPFGAG